MMEHTTKTNRHTTFYLAAGPTMRRNCCLSLINEHPS
jgi:hypothetical protein